MRALIIPALVCLVATPAFSQSSDSAPGHMESVRAAYDGVKGFITSAAENMPEENYAFHPNPEMPEVRTFAQLLGHIANANFMICAMAQGEENPNADNNYEDLTGKSELVEAVNESFAYCDDAYAISDEEAGEAAQSFQGPSTKLAVLAFNTAHDYEHYGNIVTYMRINGLVPPSTQGQ